MKTFGLVILSALLSLVVLTGCGYKPSVYYAKKEIYGKVYVDLDVDVEDPKNSVLVKDAMNELLVNKLDARLVYNASEADTLMNLKLNSVSLSKQSYSEDGYVQLYKANVSINVEYNQKNQPKKSFSVSGAYDFSVEDGGIVSNTKRFEAIKNSADRALDQVLSKIAVQGYSKNAQKKLSK